MLADTILLNGPVYTMDRSLPRAEAVALAANRVLAVGGAEEIAALRGPKTEVIDLGGRPLLPAFTDCHIHFLNTALARQRLDVSHARSAADVAAAVTDRAAITPPGQWLVGNGWDRNVWQDTTLPTKATLDAAAPEHPVALHGKDLHSMWVNSLALTEAGIDATTPDPPGGVIVRDAGTGELRGVLLERACTLISKAQPRPTDAECAAALRTAMPLAWAAGITGVHQMGDKPDGRAFHGLQILQQRRELDLRVLYYLPLENLAAAKELGIRSGLGGQRLRIGGVKLFADGALGSRTAWMLEPFEDEPENCGVPWQEPERLREVVRQAS